MIHRIGYGVIVAGPPWRWEPYSRETGMDRAAGTTAARSESVILSTQRSLVTLAIPLP
jgi:hypothetical protein